jgi:hypothetical protein
VEACVRIISSKVYLADIWIGNILNLSYQLFSFSSFFKSRYLDDCDKNYWTFKYFIHYKLYFENSGLLLYIQFCVSYPEIENYSVFNIANLHSRLHIQGR